MEGKTLFVTTHYMEEAERCHQLAFLALGSIVAKGTPTTIKNALGNIRLFTINLSYTPLTIKYLSKIKGIILINQFGDELRLMVKEECNIQEIQKILKDKLNTNSTLKNGIPNLEDVFIALTQEKAL